MPLDSCFKYSLESNVALGFMGERGKPEIVKGEQIELGEAFEQGTVLLRRAVAGEFFNQGGMRG